MSIDSDSAIVDPWTLRCLFGLGKFIRRHLAGDFRIERTTNKSAVRTMPNLPKGTRHQIVKAIDANGVLVFCAHHFVNPQGIPLRGNDLDLDPRALMFRGQKYQKDEGWKNPAESEQWFGATDPIRRTRFGTIAYRVFGWFYAKYRKFLCFLDGR